MTDVYRPLRSAEAVALTLAAVSLDTAAVGGTLRLYSNRKFHVEVGAAATVSSTPINADHPEFIAGISPGEQISVVKAAGETDGTIWATFVARA